MKATMEEPNVTANDAAYANVYAPLDGRWAGEFIIYEHPQGQSYVVDIPMELHAEFLQTMPLKESNRIQVEQEYISKSPYFQTVNIRDSYAADGKIESIESHGVNKVQDGKLWCIVQKPDEKIIHQGSAPKPNVIVWQGSDEMPFRKELFYETVHKDTYEIIGYGYYGEDNPDKSPRLWFHGKYQRVKNDQK
ncbi:MAG: hypothetical protein KTR24_18200 [Saprospiraceae bacterium]|nr:hypothetical protein [Saprospiraceae bacterium]